MFEVHTMLNEAAIAFRNAGGFVNGCISLVLCIMDICYLVNLFNIPFYIRDIAKNTGRK